MGNPYFQPFVMADGSTRRPIVERAPECRPLRGNGYDVAGLMHTPKRGLHWRGLETDRPGFDGAVWGEEREDVALALCRCACEDWLRQHQGLHSNTKTTAEYAASAALLIGGDDLLCRIAHAVADAKGIAP